MTAIWAEVNMKDGTEATLMLLESEHARIAAKAEGKEYILKVSLRKKLMIIDE